jgi:hypothetical protein
MIGLSLSLRYVRCLCATQVLMSLDYLIRIHVPYNQEYDIMASSYLPVTDLPSVKGRLWETYLGSS